MLSSFFKLWKLRNKLNNIHPNSSYYEGESRKYIGSFIINYIFYELIIIIDQNILVIKWKVIGLFFKRTQFKLMSTKGENYL
jgi:hypothetical protein